MRSRILILSGAAMLAASCAQLRALPGMSSAGAAKPAAAQPDVAAKAPAGLTQVPVGRKVPRTRDGKPDVQGFWNGATLTPLERRGTEDGKAVLSADEAKTIERNVQERRERLAQPSNPERTAPPVGGDGSTGAAGNVGGYNNFWVDIGTEVTSINGQKRASLIVDPPTGRVPQMTPEARERFAAMRQQGAPRADAGENEASGRPGAYDNVEQRPLGERCLMGFGSTSGPPALPVMYNNIKQLVVTGDTVMILNEMVHDARIVRMNSKHLPTSIRRWMGDSIGRWDGDTLVVETTNFTNKTRFRGSGENLKVTERFTRADDKTLLYQFTVEDPTTWTQPWSGEYTWARSEEPIYEYACHEANYSLEGILKGARLREAEEAAKAAEAAKPAAKPGAGKAPKKN